MKHLADSNFNTNKLTNVPTPINSGDAVNKSYADTKVAIDSLAINVLDHGVTGDGSTDDSAAINAVLLGGDKYVYFPAGTYRLNDYVRIYKNTYIKFHPNAIVKNHLTTGNVMFLNGERGNATYATGYTGDGNITIEGGTFDCAPRTATPANSMSIALAHAENIRIINSTFLNNRQDHQLELNACSNVVVSGCTFKTTTLTAPNSREFINIDYSFSGGFPHFGGYDSTPCRDVTVRDCYFLDGDVAVGSHSPPDVYLHSRIRILDNTIINMYTHGITSQYWELSNVSGNTIKTVGSNGIRARGTILSIISNNTIIGGCSAAAIVATTDGIWTPSTLTVTGNRIETITGDGIHLTATQSDISSNRLQGTGALAEGIVANEGLCTITNNIVVGFSYGIHLNASSQSVVSSNVVSSYTARGIVVGIGSDTGTTFDALISNNRVRSTGTVNSIVVGAQSTRLQRYGNRLRDGGAIIDSGSGTITTATDSL